MPGRAHRRIAVLLLTLPCLAAAPADAGAKSCTARQMALVSRPHGAATARIWCVSRPAVAKTQAGVTVAIARLLAAGRLSPKRLQQRVPRMRAARERAFGRRRDAQLRRATIAAQAARARAAGTSQGPIAPGPGQTGDGYGSEGTTSSTEQDAEHATVHKTHTSKLRRTAFGPQCPDFDGNVVTNISMVLEDVRTEERRGKRTTVDTTAKITGTLSGGFTDSFAFRGPLELKLDFVIETRVSTAIAATGKPIGREPTSTRRVSLTESIAGDSLGSLEGPIETLSGMTTTATAGPHGVLTIKDFEGDKPLMGTLVGLTWVAKILGEGAFAKTVENAAGFGCVVATSDPVALTLASGASGGFTVVARGLDDQRALPSSANARVFSGNLTMSPLGSKLPGPPGGTPFQVTSGGGKGVAEVVMATRRGYAPTLRIPVAEPSSIFPKRFVGTWTRVYTDQIRLGAKETITGTATFVRDPTIPPVAEGLIAIPYELQSASVTWTVAGSRIEPPCTTTYSGSGTDTSVVSPFVIAGMTLQAVGGTYYYSLRVLSNALNPPLFTITLTGNGCTSTTQEPINDNYLEIGSRSDFNPAAPPDQLLTSADIALLAGHRTSVAHGVPSDDTWSFTGSS